MPYVFSVGEDDRDEFLLCSSLGLAAPRAFGALPESKLPGVGSDPGSWPVSKAITNTTRPRMPPPAAMLPPEMPRRSSILSLSRSPCHRITDLTSKQVFSRR